MSPDWLDDELKKQREMAERTESAAQRVARLKLIAQKSAPDLMRRLKASVELVVADYGRKAAGIPGMSVIEALYSPRGGFHVARLQTPSMAVECEVDPVSQEFRCFRSTLVDSAMSATKAPIDLTVDVDQHGEAFFVMYGGRLTPDEVAEQLLRPVLFPTIA